MQKKKERKEDARVLRLHKRQVDILAGISRWSQTHVESCLLILYLYMFYASRVYNQVAKNFQTKKKSYTCIFKE